MENNSQLCGNFDSELKRDFIKALFRSKHMGTKLIGRMRDGDQDVSFVEIAMMHHATTPHEHISGMQDFLFVSKPAISQMLGKLEKKGYVTRETDKENRRKVNVSLTKRGEAVLDTAQEEMNEMVNNLISSFGEDDTLELIRLVNKLADVVDEIQAERLKKEAQK
ncbi:MAG: MarR family transcriptional regulator [Clostridiales Family XIII bacterium]|nr:MarR family transcriptional regulator [Clostridiales Family XIII bacterium]